MAFELLPVFLPIAVYWIGSGIYAILMGSMKQHRLFTDEDEDTKNLVTRRQALAIVVFNQVTQVAVVTLSMLLGAKEGVKSHAGDTRLPLYLLRVAGQLAAAVLVYDAWLFWWHRATHESKFLYKHFHSVHHRLVVPYSYGAQCIHPIDSLFGDSVGAVMTSFVSGMSPTISAVFFTIVTLKGLDDHSGLWFPGSPTSRFLSSNSALHAFHHQPHGIKYNYSNFLFTIWDRLLGTYMPCSVEEREGGGYVLRSSAKDH
ncbi:hypothetical protein Taro_031362 [Colocasia esculenta]|uniref:aldehyde oxygenase (deformylating) n=1 Tax=Colocasia esculenta TaxID=4460 RepID=A0A843VNR3_COLES|nr:hypothetical protein [Colocasia esculenta]